MRSESQIGLAWVFFEEITPGYRPLRLAHLPDELSEETNDDLLGESPGVVRYWLLSAARLHDEPQCPSATHS